MRHAKLNVYVTLRYRMQHWHCCIHHSCVSDTPLTSHLVPICAPEYGTMLILYYNRSCCNGSRNSIGVAGCDMFRHC